MKLTRKQNLMNLQEKMTFEPHPNLIIGVLNETNETESGIITSNKETVEDDMSILVLALGSNVNKEFDGWLKAGDCVYAQINSGYAEGQFELGGEKYLVFRADNIIAKLKG